MKIVITDQAATMKRGTDYEVARLKQALPDAEVAVHIFRDEETLLSVLEDADACITAFLPMNETVFSRCPKLKVISVNATGFNTVDLDAAARHGVTVCAIRDYCTQEVAEHTMAVMLALVRKLKFHGYRLEKDKVWSYKLAAPIERLSGKTLTIFGFGRIGQAVAARAKGFGLNILAVDPYLPPEIAAQCGAELVDKETAAERADIVTNHMNVLKDGEAYFDAAFFASLRKTPVFLNMGRGVSVDEHALLAALESGQIRAAGMDVLADEQPDPAANPLFGRDNVIITPHSAFYSEDSFRALQDISCDNLIAAVTGRTEDVHYIVNPDVLSAGRP